MKHYKVVNKQNNKEVWRGIADSKWEALDRGYSKMIFINPCTNRKDLVVKLLTNKKQ